MITIAEQDYYKFLKEFLGVPESFIVERFKDIRHVMKRDKICFREAQQKCADTILGSIRKQDKKIKKEDKKVLNLQTASV